MGWVGTDKATCVDSPMDPLRLISAPADDRLGSFSQLNYQTFPADTQLRRAERSEQRGTAQPWMRLQRIHTDLQGRRQHWAQCGTGINQSDSRAGDSGGTAAGKGSVERPGNPQLHLHPSGHTHRGSQCSIFPPLPPSCAAAPCPQ